MANAKSIGWAIYVAGFVIWLFGYVSTGHAAAFDWDAATPWWISSFIPNLEAELGLAFMFASMIPIYWRAGRKRSGGLIKYPKLPWARLSQSEMGLRSRRHWAFCKCPR